MTICYLQVANVFQSTRPRGARPTRPATASRLDGFNPRAHAERDVVLQFERDCSAVSIHAPTRSATQLSRWMHTILSFNPRAHAERDSGNSQIVSFVMFQSTRPRGARLLFLITKYLINVSIHAPTRSATFYCLEIMYSRLFQSTRPRGARLHVL